MSGGGMNNYAQNNYNAGLIAGQQGEPLTADPGHPEYAYYKAGWDAGQPRPAFQMPEMPSFPDPRLMMEEQEKRYEQQRLEQQRSEGLRQRDDMLSARLDAATSSFNYVDTEISRERSNARLLGIDYDITEDQRQTRISDYFSTVWGAGEEDQLSGLMKEWGEPENWEGFTVERGKGGLYANQPATTETVATSKGIKPRNRTQATEGDDLLASIGILG